MFFIAKVIVERTAIKVSRRAQVVDRDGVKPLFLHQSDERTAQCFLTARNTTILKARLDG